jgi:hypothetical protein
MRCPQAEVLEENFRAWRIREVYGAGSSISGKRKDWTSRVLLLDF